MHTYTNVYKHMLQIYIHMHSCINTNVYEGVMSLTFKGDSTPNSFLPCHLFYMLSMIIVSCYICTRVHLYTIVYTIYIQCVQIAPL